MDFIERWLHIAPDGGNGMLELAYIAIALVAVTATVACRRSLRRLVAIGVGLVGRR
jgi:hypothetical protein